MKRKRFWILCCILALTVLLAGCANGQQAAEQIESPTGKTQTEKNQGDASAALKSTSDSSAQSERFPTENTRAQPEAPETESSASNQIVQQPSAESARPQSSNSSSGQTSAGQKAESKADGEENTATKMNVQVGNSTFTASLEDNAAVDAFMEMMENAPVVVQMRDYAGFEKVGSLGTSLPTSDVQTTTHAGDIMLYNGNQIVIFYGSNSWSYTRLGKMDDLSGWEKALGSGDVTVTFSIGK